MQTQDYSFISNENIAKFLRLTSEPVRQSPEHHVHPQRPWRPRFRVEVNFLGNWDGVRTTLHVQMNREPCCSEDDKVIDEMIAELSGVPADDIYFSYQPVLYPEKVGKNLCLIDLDTGESSRAFPGEFSEKDTQEFFDASGWDHLNARQIALLFLLCPEPGKGFIPLQVALQAFDVLVNYNGVLIQPKLTEETSFTEELCQELFEKVFFSAIEKDFHAKS